MANTPEPLTTEAAQVVSETDLGAAKLLEPSALWLEPYQWVSVAMLVLIAIMLWKKVPSLVTGGLDNKIAEIKAQLDEAKALRAEAEKLRDEYTAKIANAEKDAEAMMENARHEADAILEKAEADSKALVERRKKMAEDKISAAERDAVDEVRATAAAAAAAASRKLIAEKHDAEADRKLADEVIAEL
ncbi:ATP synthase subunit B [Erythrobacter litoralis]|uniref:ATP synthase subunit b n=1 Tax=Erythrobacter litoralis (strain HTCC2594) TaxID=314225 RepID=ATPF_ERYLH|nr:ATP synthase subunit B [Erythrobacter litoralis]Q2N9P5.1 RecName: Full=ATP synthase subunit b; AltName: Full=ATP synthase F(0) sector subunit b; AltName: Full=ATPase subunit I; AltName: Full=F-type ATPase subunit b; Short=F-ATPase subunit b [Erythrobacter litoralis HTCC2594]ABC63596.1 AtpF, ATP synthase F0, B subunit [Erythrobacter litoralis HTCC2594]